MSQNKRNKNIKERQNKNLFQNFGKLYLPDNIRS